MNGWLALSPLFVFLAVYLAGSIIAHDFYKVPVAAAFIIASAYALIITLGTAIVYRGCYLSVQSLCSQR